MRRLVVLLAFAVSVGGLGVVACGGGNDKEPLTPDNVEAPAAPSTPDVDAAAPSTETPAPAPSN